MNGTTPSNGPNGARAEDICLTCGLCCNGAIFADVKLQPDDDTARLASIGLPIGPVVSARRSGTQTNGSLRPHVPQPCAALEGCRCRVYAERPRHCRAFECLLLKSVKGGMLRKTEALRIIQTARARVDEINRLLRELGDAQETAPLAARFRRTTRRVEAVGLSQALARRYGELTLVIHDLNLILSESFYPGGGPQAASRRA